MAKPFNVKEFEKGKAKFSYSDDEVQVFVALLVTIYRQIGKQNKNSNFIDYKVEENVSKILTFRAILADLFKVQQLISNFSYRPSATSNK